MEQVAGSYWKCGQVWKMTLSRRRPSLSIALGRLTCCPLHSPKKTGGGWACWEGSWEFGVCKARAGREFGEPWLERHRTDSPQPRAELGEEGTSPMRPALVWREDKQKEQPGLLSTNSSRGSCQEEPLAYLRWLQLPTPPCQGQCTGGKAGTGERLCSWDCPTEEAAKK